MDVTQAIGELNIRRRDHVRRRANVAELERWSYLASGAVAIAYGLSGRSRARTLWSAAGTALVYRGLTVHSSLGVSTGNESQTRAALAGDRGIHVRASGGGSRTCRAS